MKQTRHPRLHLAGLFSALAVVVTSGQITSASGVQSSAALAPAQATRCAWTVDQLPRTPDAVEGWYRACERSAFPGTPDAVEAWTS